MRSWPELFAVAWVALSSGCIVEQEPKEPEGIVPQSLTERACPPASIVTFEDFGGPFMSNWCTGCHNSQIDPEDRQGAPADVNFDTLADVDHWADRIWARSADHNTSMPPAGGPDEEARTMLGDWLACGAPTWFEG